MKTPALTAIAFVAAVCVASTAFSNGRKPVAVVTLKAQVETSEGKSDIFNVRLSQGTNELSEFEAKKGPIKEVIKLSNVKSIVFVEISSTDKDYAVFDVLLNEAETSRKLALKVKYDEKPLVLKGMTPDHTTFEVSLVDCVSVKFSPQGEDHKDPEWPIREARPKR